MADIKDKKVIIILSFWNGTKKFLQVKQKYLQKSELKSDLVLTQGSMQQSLRVLILNLKIDFENVANLGLLQSPDDWISK